MINAYLQSKAELDDHVIHLLFAANRWELATTITQTLESGTNVLCDRYAFSGVAFSASKAALKVSTPYTTTTTITSSSSSGTTAPVAHPYTNPDLSYTWCRNPERGLPSPDLTLFLDISPSAAAQRGGYGEERYEKAEMQLRVREVFSRIGNEMNEETLTQGEGGEGGQGGGSGGGGENGNGNGDGKKAKWVIVDAGRDLESVTADIWSRVEPLSRGIEAPIGRLWFSAEE